MRRIWWAPNNASSWQMAFNSAFKGLKEICRYLLAVVFGGAVLYTVQYSTDCYLECNFACCVRLDSQVAFRVLFRYNLIKLSRRQSNLPGDLRRVLSLPSTDSTAGIVYSSTTRCMNLCLYLICVLSREIKAFLMGWPASKMGFYFRKLILNWKRLKCSNRDIRSILMQVFCFLS